MKIILQRKSYLERYHVAQIRKKKNNYSGWNKAGPKALPIQPTVTASLPFCGSFLKGTVRKPPTRYYSNCTNNNIKITIAINKQNHWLADSYLTTKEWIKTFAHWLLWESWKSTEGSLGFKSQWKLRAMHTIH